MMLDARDMDKEPYTKDEIRAVEYLVSIAPDIGAGDDPIGFLLASHNWLTKGKYKMNKPLTMRAVKPAPPEIMFAQVAEDGTVTIDWALTEVVAKGDYDTVGRGIALALIAVRDETCVPAEQSVD